MSLLKVYKHRYGQFYRYQIKWNISIKLCIYPFSINKPVLELPSILYKIRPINDYYFNSDPR